MWGAIGKIVGGAAGGVILALLLSLDMIVYSFINWIYQIILVIVEVDILGNGTIISDFIGRVYVIIGVVMLFLLAYSLLNAIVSPDNIKKDKKSAFSIIKDVIISIVLIAFIPTIFSFAMQFQNAVLRQNTIGKLVIGSSIDNNATETIANGGKIISRTLLEAFIHPVYEECEYISDTEGYDCNSITVSINLEDVSAIGYDEFWDNYLANNILNLMLLYDNIWLWNNVEYTWLISTIAGIFVVFVLLTYCLDLAIRTIKLTVYELFAPVAILARLIPGEQGKKTFSNWLKATLSTYLEVFIRLAILFFVIFVLNIVLENIIPVLTSAFNVQEAGFFIVLLAQGILVIGLVLFIKQAPGIIKEVTGLDGGKYNVFSSAMKSAASLGGGITAAVRNYNDSKNKGETNSNKFKSTVAGFGSGAMRSTWNRDNVKDINSMRSNARDSANKAFQRHQERAAYKQSHKEEGVIKGHVDDTILKIKYWAQGNVDDKRLQSIVEMAAKTGKGANDQLEDLCAIINSTAKEQKRQLDALKNKVADVSDYYDNVQIINSEGKEEIRYIPKGTILSEPATEDNTYSAKDALKTAQEATTTLYKKAKTQFEETLQNSIAVLYTTDLAEQRRLWGIKDDRSDEEAKKEIESFKNQITARLNTINLDQTIAKQTDALFNEIETLDILSIKESLSESDRNDYIKIGEELRKRIDKNKNISGEIQRDAEFKAAEAKARNAKLNSGKKD